VVLTSYGEAAPEEVDALVTRPIEGAVSTVKGLRSLNSESTNGVSTVTLRLDWGSNINSAAAEVREKLDLITRDLPREVKLPIVMHYNPADAPVAVLALYGSKDLTKLRVLAEKEIGPYLETLPGVASVRINGGLVQEIQILADGGRLTAQDIGLEDLFDRIKNANINFPGGKVTQGPVEFSLRTVGRFKTLEQIGQVPLGPGIEGGMVRVQDVAKIVRSHRDRTSFSRMNGEPAVLLSVIKEPEANTARVSRSIRTKLGALRRSLPPGTRLEIAVDHGPFIEKALRNLGHMVLVGSVLAFLVLVIGLRDLRSSILVMTSIPVSIFATFGLMALFGVSVNFMSIGGLALGVGMLVDGSIVVLESIHRNRRINPDLLAAAEQGLSEVKTSVISGTVTTVAVLVPIMFMSGLGQRLFRDLSFTLSCSLLVSLLVCLLLLPALIVITDWGRPKAITQAGADSFLKRIYERSLVAVLRRRILVVILSVLVFLASVWGIALRGFEVLPHLEQEQFVVNLVLPPDSSIKTIESAVGQAESLIQGSHGISNFVSEAGSESSENWGALPQTATANEARITIGVKPGEKTGRIQERIIRELKSSFANKPEIQVDLAQRESFLEKSLGVAGSPEILRIVGNDLKSLSDLSDKLKNVLSKVAALTDVRSEGNIWVDQQRVVVDRYKAAALGLTNTDVANQVRIAVEGRTAGKFVEGDTETDIRVRLRPEDIKDAKDLERFRLLRSRVAEPDRGASPDQSKQQVKTVPLYQVAQIKAGQGPRNVLRSDRRRSVVLHANVKGIAFSKAQEQSQNATRSVDLPEGYEIQPGSESFQLVSTMSSLAVALALAVMLVYMVLVIHFESFRWPLVILAVIPMTIWGPAMVITLKDMPVSLLVVIGGLVLIGIVVNIAILLVTYVNQLRSQSSDFREALVQGATVRLKPILMTTLTTVMGTLPICLSWGGSESLATPLALTVVSGLLASLLATLFVVPVLLDLWSGERISANKSSKTDLSGAPT